LEKHFFGCQMKENRRKKLDWLIEVGVVVALEKKAD
jgi:hypothetical protein